MTRRYIDLLPQVSIEDIRRFVGGRARYNRLSWVQFIVDDKLFRVKLLPRKANIGDRPQRYLQCGGCQGASRVLRLYDNELLCQSCLRRRGLKYRSQVQLKNLLIDEWQISASSEV